MNAAKDGPGAMRKALLLVGSPRGAKSTSRMLGGYLMGKLEAGGWRRRR
jgi:hypothetical protein